MAAKRKKINVALQGGGSHGAFAWGVIDELLADDRFEIDSISATSAGSVNAVLIAQGLISGGNAGAREILYDFWKNISEYGKYLSPIQLSMVESFFKIPADSSYSYFMFNMMTELLSPYQFNPLNYNPLRELLDKHIHFEEIAHTDLVKLFICATNVVTGKVKIFDNKEISTDVILASSCLPFLFQSVEIDGEHYWDGGYMGNPPIFPIIYNSTVNDILIIHINPIIRKDIPKTSNEIVNRINEISFNSSLMREMRAISFVTKLIDDQWIKDEYADKLKKIYVHSIRSDEIMASFSVASKFQTDWKFLSSLYDRGKETMHAWLKKNYQMVGKQSTVSLEDYM